MMEFSADRAKNCSYYTVRESVRIVSSVERRGSGVDLFARPELQLLLEGILRERPPCPVLPLRPAQVEKLFAYRPRTKAQCRVRVALLLSYAAGLGLSEHVGMRCEMVEFTPHGATVSEVAPDRPLLFIGMARDQARCPVRALRELIGERERGPLYTSPRSRGKEKGLTYDGLGCEIRRFGTWAGVVPLSNERVRFAGIIEQARHIDIVRLAHYHGYRSAGALAAHLGRYIDVSSGARYRWGR
jgi:hypothetical protein